MTANRARLRADRSMLSLGAVAVAAGALSGCASAPAAAPVDANYRDGSYRADGAYQSPAGGESIIVVVELQDDVVTGVEIGLYPTSATSSTYQSQFRSGIGELVIGRDIDELDVTVVAGSSLTSTGFRAALESIKADAVEG